LNILNDFLKKWFDLSKNTHLNKPYIVHAEECRKLTKELLRIYNYPQELESFAILLCDLHDIGKLLPKWSVNVRRRDRPLHAIEGAELLLNNKTINICSLNPHYNDVLMYAIMTHHSSLLTPLKLKDDIEKAEKRPQRNFDRYYKSRELCNKINKLIRDVEKQRRCDLADLIGIVKMADILSAKGVHCDEVLAQYHWPQGLEDKLKDCISKRAYKKRGTFDEFKFKKQMDIASLKERNIVVAAPTGWGKTALALARIVFIKPIKVFYILPTITAIKDFYDTFTETIDEKYIGEYFYFADVELLGKGDAEEEHLLDIYRYFIPKIIITTIDQLLLTTLQIGKYHLRRFNLKNSLIILDEFHLLTPQMIASLRAFLKSLSKYYNVSYLFMSATPSPVYINLLEEALPGLKTIILTEEYEHLKRHKMNIVDQHIEEFITEKEDLLTKKSTLILVNTVKKAQQLYDVLKEDLGDTRKITLIHGDFAYKDRTEKEREINNTEILISTQVAEVSLDISFDLLITELAPIPSLIQRFGRVNRYGGTPTEFNVYICKPESYEPYGSTLINHACKELHKLKSESEIKGESAYVDESFWSYEEIYREDVKNLESKILRRIDEDFYNFFSLQIDEYKILEMLGREETWLSLPKIYLNNCYILLEKLKNINGYKERKHIYAQIKKHLVPASRSDIKKAEWNDELNLPIIENYSRDLGVIRYFRN